MKDQLERSVDSIDTRILAALDTALRPSVSELARTLSIARGTVHARLERLRRDKILEGYGPEIDPGKAGFPVKAFTTVSILQGQLDEVLAELKRIPEVLEAHVVTGRGDLLLAVAARSNDDLHEILQTVASIEQVSELSTQLALSSPLRRSVAGLLRSEVTSKS